MEEDRTETLPAAKDDSALVEEVDETIKLGKTTVAESKGFLEYLKDSSPQYPDLDTSYEDWNAETVRAGNNYGEGKSRSALSSLFQPQPTSKPIESTTTKAEVMNENHSGPSLPPKSNLKTPIPIHNNVNVAGEEAAKHRRKRTVSFDQTTRFVIDTQQTPMVDSLSQEGSIRTNLQKPLPLSIGSSNNEKRHHNSPTTTNEILTVDDLNAAGPYELEAETHLLKIIEEHNHLTCPTNTAGGINHMSQQHHQRYRSESSSIMSSIPDDIAHDFSSNDDYDCDGEEKKAEGSYATTSKEPTASVDDKHSTGSSKNTKKSTQTAATPKAHRRLMSVEDRLAGLTIAMKKIDQQVDNGIDTGTIMRPDVTSGGSAAEKLGYNAVQIMGGGQTAISREQRGYSQDFLDPVSEEPDDVLVQDSNTDYGSSGDDDIEAQQQPEGPQESSQAKKRLFPPWRRNPSINLFLGAADKFKKDLEIWQNFFSPRKDYVFSYMRTVMVYCFIPFIGVAAILFYIGHNPPTGRGEDVAEGDSHKASVSWWLLFCVRQVVTFSTALCMQMIVIDLLCIGTRLFLRLLGPLMTLLLVQSKGWPFVVFSWCICNFCVLYGDSPFAHHWGYWQTYVGLFNAENPSGHVVDSLSYKRILTIGVSVSLTVAFKRFIIGLYLGRKTFGHYGEQLAKVMNKLVMISEVSHLAKKVEKRATNGSSNEARRMATIQLDKESFYEPMYNEDDELSAASTLKTWKTIGNDKVVDFDNRDPLTGSLKNSEKRKIAMLLDRWEEPDRQSHGSYDKISISSVLRFRNALNLIKNDYPFSYTFGPADTREACIESSQEVYRRLLMMNPDNKQYLHFDSLAVITLEDGVIDQQKAKDLIKIFRPDREGGLTVLDFVKSTDSVYKEFRLLQASIENSSMIDRAFENLINIFFYAVLITIIMSQLGLDPLALFLSLSSIILAFAFMIGSASSKYFEGLLFILVRRPYGIGDLIHVSNVDQDTPIEIGAPCWIVQHVTLFETVVTSLPTQERASLSNGSLANSRVINWARSPHAKFNITLTFPIETRYETLEIFKQAIEEYLKIRPREWLALNGFRVNRIATDKGFVQVVLTVIHRESWQSIGQCLDSRANMISYCQEVQKKLGMQYRAPSLPIDFKNFNPNVLEGIASGEKSSVGNQRKGENDEDEEDRVLQFQNMARTRHHIFL